MKMTTLSRYRNFDSGKKNCHPYTNCLTQSEGTEAYSTYNKKKEA
jgi:hypothetical protein